MPSLVIALRAAALTACALFVATSAPARNAAPTARPTGQAAPTTPASRPTLPAAISDYLGGRWTGSGTFTRSGRPLSSVYEFIPVLNGEALQVHHAEDAPLIFAWQGVISLDTVTQDVVLLMAGNQAGGARLMRSGGWTGDSLVFEAAPDLHAWFARERITFERLGPDRFRATYEMSRDNGATWASGDIQTFDRAPSPDHSD